MAHSKNDLIKDRVKETMEFMVFSIKENTEFSGAVSFCLTTNKEPVSSFTIHISEDDNIKSAEAFDGIQQPTTCITMDADDFFHVYSGEASTFEVTKMILRRKISVDNHDYSKVSSFASSFDYSSGKWIEFYEARKMLDKLTQHYNQLFQLPVLYSLTSFKSHIIMSSMSSSLSMSHSSPFTFQSLFNPSSALFGKSVSFPSYLERVLSNSHQHFSPIKTIDIPSDTDRLYQQQSDGIVSETLYISLCEQLHQQSRMSVHNKQSYKWINQFSVFFGLHWLNEDITYPDLFGIENCDLWMALLGENMDGRSLVLDLRNNLRHVVVREMFMMFLKASMETIDYSPLDVFNNCIMWFI